uniref:Flavin-containing monooxygenase n=1 Tax=Quercus lobata TaxID=97700 RepID=A0A7N2N2Q8_QUELO
MKNKDKSSSFCNNRRRRSSNRFCNLCKRFGHSIETCYHHNKSAVSISATTVANTESDQPMAPVFAQSRSSRSTFTISRDDLINIIANIIRMVGNASYSSSLLALFGMSPTSWLMDSANPSLYRRLVGSLVYLTVTCPNISYVVHQVSQYLSAPRSTHYAVVLRILRYLKGTLFHGLFYSAQSPLVLRAFFDTDWAGDPTDRRSTTGYCFLLGSSLISWRSKKQTFVAHYSTEAEYRALADTTSELLWLRWLLKDLGVSTSSATPIYCDNQSAIHIAHNDVFHERTKHIEIDCHFIRYHLVHGALQLFSVSSKDQLVDIFTKSLLKGCTRINKWPGKQMHSHNYRDPKPFQDQVVVLIGNSASAFDISRELAGVAKEVHIAARTVKYETFGKQPAYDNLWLHPMIKNVCEDGSVHFQDGSFVIANIIIHCTGYKYHFPFLETNGFVIVDDNHVGPLYKHIFPPALAPWLSFVGIPFQVITFPMFELQSKWIAGVLSNRITLPSQEEMMEDVKALYSSLEASGTPKRDTHALDDKQVKYNNWLAGQCGCPAYEDWRMEMYYATVKGRLAHLESYRDEWETQHLVLQAYEDFIKPASNQILGPDCLIRFLQLGRLHQFQKTDRSGTCMKQETCCHIRLELRGRLSAISYGKSFFTQLKMTRSESTESDSYMLASKVIRQSSKA